MATVGEHYEELLADLYAWMLGDFDARVEAQQGWLRGIVDGTGGIAIDLGAGTGAEAIALARLGHDVVAVDASAKLVAQMHGRVADAGLSGDVEIVHADLVAFLEAGGDRLASLVVCLGDTLTHLESPAAVQRMFRAARRSIASGGRLVVSFRDLSHELHGLDRFFLVRSDASRILTCFVEYLPDRAIVHDIVHVRSDDRWEMRTSSYAKLRLAVDDVCAWLADAGFGVVERVPCGGGMVGLTAR
jgi:SAM-dependent methyltransferase